MREKEGGMGSLHLVQVASPNSSLFLSPLSPFLLFYLPSLLRSRKNQVERIFRESLSTFLFSFPLPSPTETHSPSFSNFILFAFPPSPLCFSYFRCCFGTVTGQQEVHRKIGTVFKGGNKNLAW